ncbi:aromatic acid decarboxylase [Salinivibrio sp. IB574]|uniref:flavin prenyltransferase UbiX n=1 Tax=Salinivibrio sp. IB574 TaxID=1909444 RepID=UPI000988CA83|nr:flavin prenyltransferase UbiX [Salinivibrio sp. IB574]OOF21345.1 aromatic acid decarboxylase [Salinivibrio sp. IB574]
MADKRITLAWTGASGAPYGLRLLECLLAQDYQVFLLMLSPVASGSAAPKQMVVCPCSAGSLASIAHGLSDNLIERAADVVLKERGQLLLVVRETPFSTLHLENMHKLSQMGVTIMPAAPGFYHQPQSIDDLVDFMVARILDHIGAEQQLVPRWGYDQRER